MTQILQLLFQNSYFTPPLPPQMDEFNYFQFLNDDNEILQAEDQHSRDFPTFRVHFGECFDDFLPSRA